MKSVILRHVIPTQQKLSAQGEPYHPSPAGPAPTPAYFDTPCRLAAQPYGVLVISGPTAPKPASLGRGALRKKLICSHLLLKRDTYERRGEERMALQPTSPACVVGRLLHYPSIPPVLFHPIPQRWGSVWARAVLVWRAEP